MGDRVAVLKDGLLQQVGTPRELYDHPDNVFVAGFIGSPAMNLVRRPTSSTAASSSAAASCPSTASTLGRRHGKPSVTVGFRPEDLDASPTTATASPSRSTSSRSSAPTRYVYGHATQLDGETHATIVARVDGRTPPDEGRDGLRRPRRRATCTCSTPRPASASATDRVTHAGRTVRRRRQPAGCRPPRRRRLASADRRCQDGPHGPQDHRRPADPALLDLPWDVPLEEWPDRARSPPCPAASPGTSCASCSCPGASSRSRRSTSRWPSASTSCCGSSTASTCPCVEPVARRHRPDRRRRRAARRRRSSPGTCSSRCPTARCSPRRCAPTPPTRLRRRARRAARAAAPRRLLLGRRARCRTRCSAATPARSPPTSSTPRPASCTTTAHRRPARARPRDRPDQHRRRADGPRGRRPARRRASTRSHVGDGIVAALPRAVGRAHRAASRSTRGERWRIDDADPAAQRPRLRHRRARRSRPTTTARRSGSSPRSSTPATTRAGCCG